MKPRVQKLSSGSDDAGEVLLYEGRILRGVFPGYGEKWRRILGICRENNLFEKGIVGTVEIPSPFPELGYEMVLDHERIPFISYPHEWSASMLKDAALFEMDLALALYEHGLALKDYHPYNIAFDFTKPVHFDFTSIIPVAELKDEDWLAQQRVPQPLKWLFLDADAVAVYRAFALTFEPYFLFPLYLMRQKRHEYARRRLGETMMNAWDLPPLNVTEVFGQSTQDQRAYYKWLLKTGFALREPGLAKVRFFERLRRTVASIDVEPQETGYFTYYEDKGEDFSLEPCSSWRDKQRAVYEALTRLRPVTVLDLGSNTGWYSLLAAKLGCQVVATDIDESCVDLLYKRAKQDVLPILPLVVDVNRMMGDVYAVPFERNTLIEGDAPIYLAAQKRLRCDMVLALAILHHMSLGDNLAFPEVVSLLSSLARRYLVIEFVGKDDALVASDPGDTYFSAYKKNPQAFEWYTLDNLVQELKRHFDKVEVRRSYPETRALIVCKKRMTASNALTPLESSRSDGGASG